jgi:hypothetical protein
MFLFPAIIIIFLFGKAGVVRSIVSRYLEALATTAVSSTRHTTFEKILGKDDLQKLIACTRFRSMPAFSLCATFGRDPKVEGKN